MRRDLGAAGLPTKRAGHLVDFHATRRSFATWLSAKGVAEALITHLLGRPGVVVTDRHYRGKALSSPRPSEHDSHLGYPGPVTRLV